MEFYTKYRVIHEVKVGDRWMRGKTHYTRSPEKAEGVANDLHHQRGIREVKVQSCDVTETGWSE